MTTYNFDTFQLSVAPDSSGVAGTYVEYLTAVGTVEESGGERSTFSQHYPGQDYPDVEAGKRSAYTLNIRAKWDNGVAGLLTVLQTHFSARSKLWVKLFPIQEVNPGTTYGWEWGPGQVTNIQLPSLDPASAVPGLMAVTISFAKRTDVTVTLP